VYDSILSVLNTIGQYDIEGKKTSLHITHGRAFLGVHPRKDSLLLNIVTSSPISSKRIKKSEKVSANRYHNEIVLGSADEVDDELRSWIEQAYVLTSS
jgi:hypothetical protein